GPDLLAQAAGVPAAGARDSARPPTSVTASDRRVARRLTGERRCPLLGSRQRGRSRALPCARRDGARLDGGRPGAAALARRDRCRRRDHERSTHFPGMTRLSRGMKRAGLVLLFLLGLAAAGGLSAGVGAAKTTNTTTTTTPTTTPSAGHTSG